MNVSKTKLKGVLEIAPQVVEDHRGVYLETWNDRDYPWCQFVQDDYSRSTKGVLRGLHGDDKTWKLVSCPLGKIYLVVLNCDEAHEECGQWQSFILSERNHRQVLIPPRFANGHLVLSEEAIFAYKQSTYYNRSSQFSIRWNDPTYGIWWPIREPILSQRDAQ